MHGEGSGDCYTVGDCDTVSARGHFTTVRIATVLPDGECARADGMLRGSGAPGRRHAVVGERHRGQVRVCTRGQCWRRAAPTAPTDPTDPTAPTAPTDPTDPAGTSALLRSTLQEAEDVAFIEHFHQNLRICTTLWVQLTLG